MANKNIIMKEKTASGYDDLFPKPSHHSSTHAYNGEDPLGEKSVSTAQLTDGAVTNDKIAASTITRAKMSWLTLLPAVDYFPTEEARNTAYPSPITGQITWVKA